MKQSVYGGQDQFFLTIRDLQNSYTDSCKYSLLMMCLYWELSWLLSYAVVTVTFTCPKQSGKIRPEDKLILLRSEKQ